MIFKVLRSFERIFPTIYTVNKTKNSCSAIQFYKRSFSFNQASHSLQVHMTGMDLDFVIDKLNSYAPTSLAESWDNVGLLVEPYSKRSIHKILLTNDLTIPVMEEAIKLDVAMIISYHPPIFTGMKSIIQKKWKDRIVAACLEHKIALYSPHTSFDAVKGGVNDWLASAFDNEFVRPITYSTHCLGTEANLVKLKFVAPLEDKTVGDICSELETVKSDSKAELHSVETLPSGEAVISLTCNNQILPKLIQVFKVSKLEKVNKPDDGIGRICKLKTPQTVAALLDKIKQHLNLPHVRLALAVGRDKHSLVSTIAVCAGSGASVLRGVQADLYLTGEMSHHEVLDAIHNGRHVVLCEHSNTERGFLKVFAHNLAQVLLEGKVDVVVSSSDADPLIIV